MRSAIVAVSAILAGIVSAQTSPTIPTCANTCITDALPSSCNLDPSCICHTPSFITSISCCISQSCDVADQQAALAYAHSICDPVGASSLLPASAGCSANSTASATSGSSSGTAAASITGSASSASASISSALSSASSSISAATSSAASSASAAATSASSSALADGKMSVQGVGLGVVGAAVLGVAALL